jgi:hypothetical protein
MRVHKESCDKGRKRFGQPQRSRARITPNGEKHRTEVTEATEGDSGWDKSALVNASGSGRESRQKGGGGEKSRISRPEATVFTQSFSTEAQKEVPQSLVNSQSAILRGHKASLVSHRGLNVLERIGGTSQETGILKR